MEVLYRDHGNEAGATVINTLPVRRIVNGVGFLLSSVSLGFAYYLQYAENLQPCPLCALQRVLVAVIGMAFLTTALWNSDPRRARNRGAVIVMIAALGLGAASYELWLQAQSTISPNLCLPPLNLLLATSALGEALSAIMRNPIGCNSVEWTFLGLNLPVWSGLGFAILAGLGLISRRACH
jgi:disulfide bond formation protein DsbB